MLKTKSRHVPIRLLCLMATFLAMALPARAWNNWYLVGTDIGTSAQETYKFTKSGNTCTLTIPSLKGKWQLMGYESDSNKKIYGSWNNADYNLSNNETYKEPTSSNYAYFMMNNGAEATDVTISFTDGTDPSSMKVSFTVPPTPGSAQVYAYGRFKDSTDSWNDDNPSSVGVLLDWNEEANAYCTVIPQNTNNAFRLAVDGTKYYPANVSGGSTYFITSFGADNKLDMATTKSTPDCWGVKPMDENATYTLYVDPEAKKIWVTKEGGTIVTVPDFNLEYGSTTSSIQVTRTTDDGVFPAVYTVTIPEYADQTWMRLIGTAGNVDGKFYGPASDVNQVLTNNEWSGNLAINQATTDRQKVVRVNTGGKTGALTLSITCSDADASDLSITSISFVPQDTPEPQPAAWKIIIGPAHDLSLGTEYAVTEESVEGSKTHYVTEKFDIPSGSRIVISDGTHTYYRKSNNDNNHDGWFVTRNNTETSPYTEMPSTPLNQSQVYLHWNSDDICGVQLHFTYDEADNGSKITNLYYTQREWGGVFAADYPHVYLLGTALNNRVVSPEYRMISTDGKKTFHLDDFAIRSNDCRTINNTYDNSQPKYVVRVYHAAGRYIDLQYDSQEAGVPSLEELGWVKANATVAGQPGWAANATFTLNKEGNDLSASTLKIENAGSGEWKKNYLPYLGILGKNFKQELPLETPRLHDNGEHHKADEGWQEAYVQYDAQGRPIIQGGRAVYNTLWPPRENILMQATLKGLNQPLNISTRTLRFWPDMDANGLPRIQTGAQWKQELSAEDRDAYAGLDFTSQTNTEQQRYVRYTCPGMWMQGEFKIWTGWAGQPAEWGAQWNNHLYFSCWPKDEIDHNFEAGKTYYATSDVNGHNFNAEKRSYFGTVEIFIPVDSKGCLSTSKIPSTSESENTGILSDNMDDTRIYVTKPKIQAQIDATKNRTSDHAHYWPTVTIPEGCTVSAYKIVRCDFTVNPGGVDPEKWQPVNRDYRYRTHEDEDAIVAQYSGEALDQDAFNARFTADTEGVDHNKWILDKEGNDETLSPGTYFYYMQITYNDGEKDRDMVVTSPYLAVIAGEYETSVRVYQLVRNLQDPTGKSYVTYNPSINVQYNVTVEDGQIISHSQRAATDRFDYGSADAEWTSMIAVATNLPGLYRFNNEPTIARKTATKFEIRYNGEQVADLAAEANRVFADRPGTTFYALKDFMDYANGKFLDFSGDWDADFTAEATFTNGTTETRTTKPENRMKNHLDLTMPAYGIDNVEFMVNSGIADEEKADVQVADALAGTGHIHAVEGALINSLDVKVSLTRPNVDSDVLPALNKELKAESLSVGDKAYRISYDDASGAKSVTLYNENPNDWIDASWQSIEKTVKLAAADGASRFVNPNLRPYVAAANQSKTAKLEARPMQLEDIRIPAIRAKIKVLDADGQEQNKFEERIYMAKTNLPLADALRSQLGDVTLNADASAQYIVLRSGDQALESNYVNVENWLEKETLANSKHYHRFSEIENTENMVVLAKSENTCTWYNGMTDDHWVDETTIPAVTLGVANFFKGDTRTAGEGVIVQAPAAAPAAQADGETATHYVLYPPIVQGTLDFSMIQTALDSVEADSLWIEAGAGFFTVKADGVAVYDASGITVAAAQGRYDVPAGVYLALKGSKAVKIYVR